MEDAGGREGPSEKESESWGAWERRGSLPVSPRPLKEEAGQRKASGELEEPGVLGCQSSK